MLYFSVLKQKGANIEKYSTRFDICILGLVYYPIIEATDYKVIGGPSETRMRSAKQNQDFHRKDCISLKAIWHKINQSEQLAEIYKD